MNDIVFLQKNLARFAKDEAAQDIALTLKLFGPKIRKDPMGAVLVIGYVPQRLARNARQAVADMVATTGPTTSPFSSRSVL